jgi:hypothetical protein
MSTTSNRMLAQSFITLKAQALARLLFESPRNLTMKFLSLFFAAAISVGAAQADPPFSQSAQLVTSAIIQGKTIRGLGGMFPATFQAMAIPYRMQGDACVSVGLIRIATSEVENWRYCQGRLERLPGLSPKLAPGGNPQLLDVITQAERSTASNHPKTFEWEDYEIIVRQHQESSPDGCRNVESLILLGEELVSRRLSNVCP